MTLWTYRCWDDGKQPSLWHRWYKGEAGAARGRHDAVFERLEQREPMEWREPDVKKIKGGKGLLEVRLNGSVMWRVFGFLDPVVSHRFVVVHVGYHKGVVYKPKLVIESAKSRKADIESGIGKVVACERPE